jgi:hypothetical protein
MLSLLLVWVALPSIALADSVDPASFSTTLGVGESVTITKTVTIDDAPPTDATVDIFFLTDSTGSMFDEIAAVQAAASTILANTTGLGDVAWGAGEYRDVGDAFVYRQNTDLTTTQATASAAIGAWSAGGGGDFFEANLFALDQVATTTSWRTDSTRILVWFGDAPGHDPSAGGVTEADATASLLGENIVVQAIDVGGMDGTGQATRITDATGGTLFSGISTSDIVDAIQAAIAEVFLEYNLVTLEPAGNLPGVDVAVAPGGYVGDFDRSTTRTFDFDVTFTGLEPGEHHFEMLAKVDGGAVAREIDWITVGDEPVIPEPSGVVLFGVGLLAAGIYRRRTLS